MNFRRILKWPYLELVRSKLNKKHHFEKLRVSGIQFRRNWRLRMRLSRDMSDSRSVKIMKMQFKTYEFYFKITNSNSKLQHHFEFKIMIKQCEIDNPSLPPHLTHCHYTFYKSHPQCTSQNNKKLSWKDLK